VWLFKHAGIADIILTFDGSGRSIITVKELILISLKISLKDNGK
jgi:hypothetical protein